jgi:hypothetical protein
MASDSKTNKPDTAVETDAAEPVLSIHDYCARLSETVQRPELINGFASSERKAGHNSDTAASFRARFDAFINQPV